MIWRSIPTFQVQRHLPEARGLNLHKQIRIGALLFRHSMHVRKQDSEHMLSQDFVHDSHVVTWHTPGRCFLKVYPSPSLLLRLLLRLIDIGHGNPHKSSEAAT
jgi:hypothetical protein